MESALGAERASGLAHTIGFWWAVADVDYFLGYTDEMARQTPADLQRYAARYIAGRPRVTGVLLSSADRQGARPHRGRAVGAVAARGRGGRRPRRADPARPAGPRPPRRPRDDRRRRRRRRGQHPRASAVTPPLPPREPKPP
jgi:hypothetical protein